jgi:hypothetical protein
METPVSVFYCGKSIISLPGFGGPPRHYSGGSAGAQARGCSEKKGTGKHVRRPPACDRQFSVGDISDSRGVLIIDVAVHR